jgi:plasmid stability protein
MGVNLSIKDVPDDVAQRLRQRAAANHRSLQGELMCIVSEAAAQAPLAAADVAGVAGRASADRPGVHLQGWKTVEDLLAERAASGWQPHPSMASAPLGVDIIRADRDAR